MIVSALVKRYEDTQDVPVGWQKRAVSYALDISEDGLLLGVITVGHEDVKKRTKRSLILPIEPPGRTSGIKASFLCDNASYILGLDDKRGIEKFEAARQIHEKVLSIVNTPTANAIKAYFNIGIPSNYTDFIDMDTASKATFMFQVNGKFVDVDDDAIRCAWNEHYIKDGEAKEQALCLVTGKRDTPEATHGTVNLRGGQMSGSRLISANAESFTSHSKTAKDRAADVGKYAAFAYVTALSALLIDKKHHQFIGEDTLVFWAEKGGEAEEELFADMMAPPKADDSKNLEDIIAKLAKGNWVTAYKPERLFYLLCLSPNAARISVRFFYVGMFGDLVSNIQAHYNRLDIVSDGRTPFRFLPPWLILSETTIKKSAGDANPLLGGQLIRSILTGMDYSFLLYHLILMRIRAGETVNQTKAAVIKAVLIKNFNESEVATVEINEHSSIKPYILGRLFSVLERLQERANGSATIRSRYFTSACANPSSVFPTLLKLSVHHSAKLDNDVYFEKLKGELLTRLDEITPFPTVLSLEDQGRFIVGYYHQTQAFFTKKDKGEAMNNE